jgi:GGDEF domain-containing protein
MREKNHLYKKVLDTAPFGTLFFAYGVCIDANHKALNLLRCERSQLVGLSLSEVDKDQPPSLIQLKTVVEKLESEHLQGLLWRSQNTLASDEIVVSVDAVENTDSAMSIMLYPLPALAQMVVQEFSVEQLPIVDTPAHSRLPLSEPVQSPQEQLVPPKTDTHNEVIAGLPIGHTLLGNINSYLESSSDDCGALLLIDLDHFNSINESLGKHMGGQILDRARHTIANMLGANMQMDQVAGDVFCCLLKTLPAPSPVQRSALLPLPMKFAALSQDLSLPKTARLLLPPVWASVCW